MLRPAHLSLISDDKMQITRDSRVWSKIVIMWKDRLEELLSIDPYEKLNKTLFENYWFLFVKEIQELKARVNDILEDEDCMTDITWLNME